MNLNLIEISMFKNCVSTLGRTVDALAIFNAIKKGRWGEEVGQIRRRYAAQLKRTGDQEKAKQAVKHLKETLPGVTWSGTFSRRRREYLLQHSGLFGADIDVDALNDRDLNEVRAKLQRSPYVVAVFLSPTGSGLKVIFKVPADAQKHLGSFRTVEQHILNLTGVQIDESGKDVVRLCFVSDDSNLYLNPNAQEIAPLPKLQVLSDQATQQKKSLVHLGKASKEEIREMLRFIPKRPHYPDWIKVTSAVFDALPDEDAIEALKEWSPEEQEGEYEEKLRHRLENVHIGTLIYLAQQHGWKGPKNHYPSRNAEAARELQKDNSAAHDSSGSPVDDETLSRLAAMPPLEYDRCRKQEAERLGIRSATLDQEVGARRVSTNSIVQGSAVEFPDATPWESRVNGADLLDQVVDTYSRYIALPPGAADLLALWTALTHAFEAFYHSPRLNFRSPEKQCGKSTGLDVMESMTARPLKTENMTAPVLFRLVEAYKPTLLLDEVDTYLDKSEELRGLLNAGHKRGAKALRCEGENNTVRGFAAFAPAALAGIGALPGTLHDRSIVVRLAKAKRGEVAARFDSRHTERETELCRKLARWAADNFDKLKNCDPQLPETAFNRLADNWRPIFAVAETAGGDWPKRASEAFAKLTSRDDVDAQGIGTTLLGDICDIFAAEKADRLPSSNLAEKLAAIEGRPWAEWGKHRKPISTNQLANQLRGFGVLPQKWRDGDETFRGYVLADFKEAFERYLPNTPFPDRHTATTLGKTPAPGSPQTENVWRPENDLSTRECGDVAFQKGGKGEMDESGPLGGPLIDELGVARL